MNTKRRQHFLLIFDKLSLVPLIPLLLAVANLIKNKSEIDASTVGESIAFIVIALLSSSGNLIKFISTFYYIDDNLLIVESGLFTKKKMQLPFAGITSIDFSQNLIHKLFKVYKVKIDNASQVKDEANNPEAYLILKEDDAHELKEAVAPSQSKAKYVTVENNNILTPSTAEFIKYGLVRSKYLGVLALLGAATFVFENDFIRRLITDSISLPSYELEFSAVIVALAFILIAAVYLGVVLISVIRTLIRYYGFKLEKEDEKLIIDYGILNHQRHTFPQEKISAIVLKQNILMRILKLYSLELSVIGYGNVAEKDGEKAILYPVANKQTAERVIDFVIPGQHFELNNNNMERCPKRALKYFFVTPIYCILFTGLIITCIVGNKWIIASALLLLAVFSIFKFLQYKNQGIVCGPDSVYFVKGSFYRKITLVKRPIIESIEGTSSYFKVKKDVGSVKVSFIGPLGSNNIYLRNMEGSLFTRLCEYLYY